MYYLQSLLLNPSPGLMHPGMPRPPGTSGPPPAMDGSPPDMSSLPEEFTSLFKARIEKFRRWQNVFKVISWTAIYCVKFSFLGFFRQLVDRLRPLELYWKGIVVFTGIAYCYCVSEPFFSCREAQASKPISHGDMPDPWIKFLAQLHVGTVRPGHTWSAFRRYRYFSTSRPTP